MLHKLIITLKKAIWLIPTIYSLLALALSIFVILLDTRVIGNIPDQLPSFLFTEVDLAKNILSTIAVSLLIMITFTFSTMMVVLTMYSSQFSPRILPNFLTDRKAITVLGVFMGSFIYALLSLFFMGQDIGEEGVISATVGILLVVLCLGFFTFFIYHVTIAIQVENLIQKLYREAIKMIEEYRGNFQKDKFIHISAHFSKETSYRKEISAVKNGYIQAIDHEGLLEEAKKFNGLVQVPVKQGKFVVEGEKIATIYTNEDFPTEEGNEGIRNKIIIGNERTAVQDIEFSLEKIVDIALRAISPGINDPNTAKECINVIGLVLGEISRCTGDKAMVIDDNRNTRLVMEGIDFKELLYVTFYQLRYYGNEDISIMLSNISALIIAAHKSSKENKKIIWDFHEYIIENEDQVKLKGMDQIHLERRLSELKSICSTE